MRELDKYLYATIGSVAVVLCVVNYALIAYGYLPPCVDPGLHCTWAGMVVMSCVYAMMQTVALMAAFAITIMLAEEMVRNLWYRRKTG